MSERRSPPQQKRQLPAAVVAIAVLATGVATVWALSKTQGAGPQFAWGQAEDGVASVWAGGNAQPADPGQMPGQMPSQMPGQVPGAMPGQTPGAVPGQTPPQQPTPESAARAVAGMPGVPAIIWGARRPHPDRGACVNCHNVVTGEGGRVPTIFSFSAMPHEFRGNCTNCHSVGIAMGAMGRPVGGTITSPGWPTPEGTPAPAAAVPMPAAPAAVAPAGPNEAEWRGLEVRPTPQGVMVTKADGTAARSGVLTGDVVRSINGSPVQSMAEFVATTQDGNLPQGTMIADRGGELLAFELNRNQPVAPVESNLIAPAPTAAPAPTTAPAPATAPAPMNWGLPSAPMPSPTAPGFAGQPPVTGNF